MDARSVLDVVRQRPLATALSIVVLVWLSACARWWWADAVVPWDSKNQFYAFFRFMAAELSAGRMPFWNPYHYGGHPSIADPQSLVFQPVFVLWSLLDPQPSLRAFDGLVLAHLLVGALAFVGLCWRRGWPASAGVMAAIVFMLGGAASGRLNHTGIIIAYGLFPLAWLLLEVALQRRSYAYGIAFALTAAVIVLGRNQVSLMLAMTLCALALREMLNAPNRLQWLRPRVGLLAVIAAVALAALAVPMLLTLQLASLSNRPAVPLDVALQASLHPITLASTAIANVFGQLTGDNIYWGPGADTLREVAATDDSFNYAFIGSTPLILLLWHGFAGRRLWQPGSRTWTLVLVTALVFALGRYGPLYPLVFEHVPGFAFFRRPIDGMFVVLVASAFLAAGLLAGLVRDGPPALDALCSALAAAGTVAVLSGALTFAVRSGNGGAALAQLLRAAPVLLGAVALILLARRNRYRSGLAVALALLTAVELLAWNAASRLNAEDRPYYEVLDTPTGEDARILSILEADIALRHRQGQRPRVEIAGLDGPWQNLAMVRRLEATNGYNPLRIGAYDRIVAPGEIAGFLEDRRFPPTFPSYDSAMARALGLEYLVLDRPIESYPGVPALASAHILLAGPRAWIYRLPEAIPRVRFVADVLLASHDAQPPAGQLAHPPSAERVVIDETTPPAIVTPAVHAGPPGTARILAWQASRVLIEVDARRPGILVLAEAYYPGWTATIDGRRTRILKADALFRAVEVPAGRHAIEMRYRPLSWQNLSDALRATHKR